MLDSEGVQQHLVMMAPPFVNASLPWGRVSL